MNHFIQTLQTRISKRFRVWHLLGVMSITWLLPAVLPDAVLQQWAVPFILVWLATLVAISKLMRHGMRKTRVDFILVERLLILVTFLYPTILGLTYGLRHGFDTATLFGIIFGLVIGIILIVGIALHLNNKDKYYHGVKKDELFK